MFNEITLPEEFSPRDADEAVRLAKLSGAEGLFVRFLREEALFSAGCREKLLSLFRSAYKRKMKIYLCDDTFEFSGTALGELSSVPDLWAEELFVSDAVSEGEEIVFEADGRFLAVRSFPENDKYPYGHYPDLTNPQAAEYVIGAVYERLIKEYSRFSGYEFAGFLCRKPCFAPPYEENIAYSKAAFDAFEGDKFAIFTDEGREKYTALCEKAFGENYISQLRRFCGERGMEFILTPAERGASAELCARASSLSNAALHTAHSLEEAVRTFCEGEECVLEILSEGEYERRLCALRSFFAAKRDNILPLGGEISDGTLLVNMSGEKAVMPLAAPEGFVIEDIFSGRIYALAEEAEFSPYGFLYVRSARAGEYCEETPIRLDGVKFGQRERLCEMELMREGGCISFGLPDEPLGDKSLEFEGDFDFLTVKIGSMELFLAAPPYEVKLFDFCRGEICRAETGGEARAYLCAVR